MGKKYERYSAKFKQRYSELPYREVNRKNLDRVGNMVLRCMTLAGAAPILLSERSELMREQIEAAYNENPAHVVVALWRVLCNFSMKERATR